MTIHYFDTLDSTNNYCKLLDPKTVEEFMVVCACCQTAGIGQQGNVWVSEPYKNLTFSIILKPSFLLASEQYLLTMMLAVATADAVASLLSDYSVSIKWPNDIYVGERKICGILTTNRIHDSHITQSICGIGLNVNQTNFPEWLPNPTSLKALSGNDFDIDNILKAVLSSIDKYYQLLKEDHDEIRHLYLSRLFRKGIQASYEYLGIKIEATITGVDRFGHLQLTSSDGKEICCDMKEVKYIL